MDNTEPVLFDVYYYRTDTPVDQVPEKRLYEACGLPRNEARTMLAELRKFNQEIMRLPYHFYIKWRGFEQLSKDETAKRYADWPSFETPDYSPEDELGHAPLPPEAFSLPVVRKVDQRKPPPIEEQQIESLEELSKIENDLPFD